VPNVYALAAHPLGQAAIRLAQEEHKTKGARAVFGVILMFGILCGGVWMLLQSSFGPKQAYLITSVAFWGCWLILSLIWLTGVGGLDIGPIHVPRSTPKYYGPQGSEQHWEIANPHGKPELLARFQAFENDEDNTFFKIDDSVTDPVALAAAASATSTAQEVVPEEYAIDLGIGAADIAVPTVADITDVQLAKKNGEWAYARITFGAAETNATNGETTNALIRRIQPKTIELVLNSGSLAEPTYWAILLFAGLFLLHLAGLVVYELRRQPAPAGAPERVAVSV
jgi:hypothetical protein